jgi:hypothetical protein
MPEAWVMCQFEILMNIISVFQSFCGMYSLPLKRRNTETDPLPKLKRSDDIYKRAVNDHADPISDLRLRISYFIFSYFHSNESDEYAQEIYFGWMGSLN